MALLSAMEVCHPFWNI